MAGSTLSGGIRASVHRCVATSVGFNAPPCSNSEPSTVSATPVISTTTVNTSRSRVPWRIARRPTGVSNAITDNTSTIHVQVRPAHGAKYHRKNATRCTNDDPTRMSGNGRNPGPTRRPISAAVAIPGASNTAIANGTHTAIVRMILNRWPYLKAVVDAQCMTCS